MPSAPGTTSEDGTYFIMEEGCELTAAQSLGPYSDSLHLNSENWMNKFRTLEFYKSIINFRPKLTGLKHSLL